VGVTVRDGRHKTDVVVVGGGPAGLAAAIAARLQGLRVVVLEAAHPPIDKVCGEGIMPEALAALRRLGVHLTPEHGTPWSASGSWTAHGVWTPPFPLIEAWVFDVPCSIRPLSSVPTRLGCRSTGPRLSGR